MKVVAPFNPIAPGKAKITVEDPIAAFGIPNEGASPVGSTHWKALLACPREYALSYAPGLPKSRRILPQVPKDALTIGIIWHYAIMVYYKVIQAAQQARWLPDTFMPFDNASVNAEWQDYFWGAQADAQKAAWESIAALQDAPGYEKEIYPTVARCLEAYFDTYWRTDRWAILAIEETVQWLGGALEHECKFDYSARLDLVVYDYRTQSTWLVEHKTANWINQALVDHYEMDLQILGQLWLFENCIDTSQYPPLGGVIVNVVDKGKTPKCVRVPVYPSGKHLAEFEHMMRALPQIRTAYAAAGWPKFLGHCSGYARGYDACQFYGLCHDYPEMHPEEWQGAPPPYFPTAPAYELPVGFRFQEEDLEP